jgi:hypothetical protein
MNERFESGAVVAEKPIHEDGRTREILDRIVEEAPGLTEEPVPERSHAEVEPRELYCSLNCMRHVKGGIPVGAVRSSWEWTAADPKNGETLACASSKCVGNGKLVDGQGVVYIPDVKAAEKRRKISDGE